MVKLQCLLRDHVRMLTAGSGSKAQAGLIAFAGNQSKTG
jgi:hypothetical protein